MSVEFTGKKACIAPEGVFIIGTYDENGVPNAMNAAWGAQSDYDEITLFLAKHKTTENIKHTKAFTVAFATISAWKLAARSTRLKKPAAMCIRAAMSMLPLLRNFLSLWNVNV